MVTYKGRKIDEGGVLREKREHPEFIWLYSKLEKELAAVNSIELFCVHEAGHLIFFRRAGFSEFEFLGPTMIYDGVSPYDDECKRYSYLLGAVRTPEASCILQCNENVLLRLAAGAAAGEVFNEVRQQSAFVPIDKSSDFDGFKDHYLRAIREALDFGYDAESCWNRAREEVKAYLQDRTNEATIQSAIMEVRFGCFKPRKSPVVESGLFHTSGAKGDLCCSPSGLSFATREHELCMDATRMVNKLFEGDSEWFKRMCEEEVTNPATHRNALESPA